MADGFYLPRWFGLQHDILGDRFCHFCRPSQGVPLWLLKRQDMYVPAGALGMAEPGFRVLAAPNKLSVVFSVAGQCCFKFWRFTHSVAVLHCALAGWLWGRQKGEPKHWLLLSICRQQLHFSCAQGHCFL